MCSLIQSGVNEGAKLLLDGRKVNVKGYENGNFVGPTIIGNVTVREFNALICSHAFILRIHLIKEPIERVCIGDEKRGR